ncbi:MAG: Wzz/FepE/Etk N-terminal domain-containing protein [Pseudomonadota bacterium]
MEPTWNTEKLRLRHMMWQGRLHAPIVIICTALGVLAGFLYLVLAPVMYTAQTTMVLESKTSQFGDVETLFLDMDTHARLIQSDAVIAKVVAQLDLQDEFALQQGAITRGVNQVRASLSRPLYGTQAVGDNAAPESVRAFSVVPKVRSSLDAIRLGETRLLSLAFTSDDPELSARIVNGFAEAYVDHLASLRDRTSALEAKVNFPATGESSDLSITAGDDTVPLIPSDTAGILDDLRIVSWATVPAVHSSPNMGAVLAVCTILGLVIGIGFAARNEWSLRQ